MKTIDGIYGVPLSYNYAELNDWMKVYLTTTTTTQEYTTYYGEIIQYIMVKTIQFHDWWIAAAVKGTWQKSYDLQGAMPFSTKMHSSCNKSYKIEYKATVMVFLSLY